MATVGELREEGWEFRRQGIIKLCPAGFIWFVDVGTGVPPIVSASQAASNDSPAP